MEWGHIDSPSRFRVKEISQRLERLPWHETITNLMMIATRKIALENKAACVKLIPSVAVKFIDGDGEND